MNLMTYIAVRIILKCSHCYTLTLRQFSLLNWPKNDIRDSFIKRKSKAHTLKITHKLCFIKYLENMKSYLQEIPL